MFNVENLVDIAREGQEVFKKLERANEAFEKRLKERLRENENKIRTFKLDSTQEMDVSFNKLIKANFYDLNTFHISLRLRGYELLESSEQMTKDEALAFDITHEVPKKKEILVHLHHNASDSVEAVVAYVENYAKHHFEYAPSFWQRLCSCFKD